MLFFPFFAERAESIAAFTARRFFVLRERDFLRMIGEILPCPMRVIIHVLRACARYTGDVKESLPDNLKKFMSDESSGGSPLAAKKALRAATLGAGMVLGAGVTHPAAAEAESIRIEVADHIMNEQEVSYLIQNVYHESRGEPLKGQLAVAQVTLARLLARKFGKTLADVVFAQNQFSWTKDPRILMTRMNDETFQDLKTTIMFLVQNKPLGEAVAALAEQSEIPARAYYYKRTDWDENDPEEKRMSKATKEMFQKLKNVGVIGSHTFYTD